MSQNIVLGYTSNLLNHAEVYYINGNPKTAIYSEINTNIQVGDKVFIMNGIYDSQKYIDIGKYAKNADGYTVLYTNNCQIVIDLAYTYSTTYTQSYHIDNLDNYKKIYNIETQREFDYINQIFVDSYTYSDYYSYNRISKFEYGLTNNIIYSSGTFSGLTYGIGQNNGILATNSFWGRNGNTWINITPEFNSGSFQGIYYNNRIMIFGEDFDYNGTLLKQRNIYNYNNTTYSWYIDTLYKKPIISRLSFQGGYFQGIHNNGIFGNYKTNQIWDNNGTWNNGFFVNSTWNSGVMNSKSDSSSASYYAELVNNKIKQHFDFSNNNSHGYNYIIDSSINSGIINNGNVFNTNITGINDEYILSATSNNNIVINSGFYDFCDFKNVKINNSETLDSIISNSNINNSQIYNSQINNSIVINSKLNGSNVLNIISADISYYYSETNQNRGILKLYISEHDFLRLDLMDNFYITNIDKNFVLNNLSLSQKLLMPYELRYVIDSIFNPDFTDNLIISLKTPFENNNITDIIVSNNINTPNDNKFIDNLNKNYSIDIDFGSYLINNPNLNKNNVNNLFSNSYISNGDINEGLVDNSEFINYNNINYNTNIIAGSSSNLSISKIDNSKISLKLNSPNEYSKGTLKIGNYVWLDSILFNNSKDISGTYSIDSITYSNTNIYLGLSNSSIVSLLTTGTYSITDGLFNKNYVYTVKISNSNIESGLFLGTLFKSSTFSNSSFDNTDLSLDNLSLLRLIGLNINDSSLTFNNATVKSSVINNAIWNNSIAIDCIWNNAIFNNGIFYDGYWLNGTFNNGLFTNNNGGLQNIVYSDLQLYNNWYDGQFNSGTFYKSSWVKGTFNNGLFYNSDWYSGIWNNGILGDNSVPHKKTTFGVGLTFGVSQSYWYDGIVKNADVGGLGNVKWYNGIFYNGTFNSILGTGSSIWYDGQFNGGDFVGNSIWQYGIFNGGKFLSTYKNSLINSTQSTDYTWQGGIFNEGLFGSQSTWYNGEFNGGIFSGIVWNNGIFSGGNFIGSGKNILLGSDSDYVNQFTQSFYGLWRDGIFSEKKQYKIYDANVNVKETAIFDSGLWQNGLFDSNSGQFNNSAWLAGNFINGDFTGSIFNPYCDSTLQGNTSSYSYNLNIIPNNHLSCIWENGNFYNGNFNFSNWNNGNFYNGNMTGAVWNAGTWYYGNANNIYWVSGTWLNGQWNGSPYDYSILDRNFNVKNGPEKQILSRIGLLNSNMHVNNVFTGTYSSIGNLGWVQSGNNLSWITGSNSIYLPNFTYSSPIFKPSTIHFLAYQSRFDIYSEYEFSFEIGSIVTPGEIYSISFGNIYTISYTVEISDSYNDVLLKLSNLINTDPYLSLSRIIWYNSQNADVAVGNGIVVRSGIVLNDHELFIYYSSLRSDLIPSVSCTNVSTVNTQQSNILNFTVASNINIFSTASNYLINITLESVGGSSEFFINYGKIKNSYTLNGKKTYTIPLKQTNSNLNKQELSIQRFLIPFGNPTFSILSYEVSIYETKYSNNCNTIFTTLINYPSISNPYSIIINNSIINLTKIDPKLVTTYKLDNGDVTTGFLTINFGNGKFGSFPSSDRVNSLIQNTSIWKGGAWNNGYWNSNSIDNLKNLTYLNIDNYTWNITLTADSTVDLTSSKYSFITGDNILISNIVGLDINNNRVLITNLNKILSVTPLVKNIDGSFVLSTITIQIITKYPILRIEQDSLLHTIKITKTSWLSGIFTNGLFEGIWTYGIVKGYPYITKFKNTHWIDGVFDGGTFKSTSNDIYSTGLIQNFTFRDNNISESNNIGTNLGFKYNSWMDLVYDNKSMTNIYKDNYTYNQEYQLSVPDMNLNGYPTYDVLSSKSYLRNSYDTNIVYYSLGNKYQIYTDFIGNGSIFNNSYSNQIAKLGLSKFYELGWTYSQDSHLNISSNTTLSNSDKLFVSNDNSLLKSSRIGIKYAIITDPNVTNANNSGTPITKTTVRMKNPGNSLVNNTGDGKYVFIGNFENTTRFKLLYYSPSHDANSQYNVKAFSNIHNNLSYSQTNDGYYNVNSDWELVNNYGKPLSASSSTTTGNSTDILFYNYWKIPTTDNYSLGLQIPFIMNLQDTYVRGPRHGGGGGYFKLFGCIEYCLFNTDIKDENNWIILGTTYMTLDPNLKYTDSFVNAYINVGNNKFDGSIKFDDRCLISGLLTIDNFSYAFNKGDSVRFNIYTIIGPQNNRSDSNEDNNDNNGVAYSDIGFNISGIDNSINPLGTKMLIAFPGTNTHASITFNPISQNIPLDYFEASYPISKLNQRILNYSDNNSGYFEVYTSNSISYLENDKVRISKNRYSLSKFNLSKVDALPNSQPILNSIIATFSFNVSNNEIIFPGLYSNVLKVGDYISLSASNDKYYLTLTNVDLTTYQATTGVGTSIINTSNATLLNTLESLQGFPLLQNGTFVLTLENRIVIPNIFQLNTPKMYSPNRNIINYVSNFKNNNQTVFNEYYYNKNIFRFYLENTGTYSILFNNINFYEVDSIPFFNYWDKLTNINDSIEIPNIATYPNIDNTKNIYDILGNISINFTQGVINNSDSNLSNYYLSNYYIFFSLLGITSSNYTTYSVINNIITIVGEPSEPLNIERSNSNSRFYINDVNSNQIYSYTSSFYGNDHTTLNSGLTHSLLIYPTDSITSTQKSKSISAEIKSSDLSPITNLELNCDYPDIAGKIPYTLNAPFSVNISGNGSTVNINTDWDIYVNGTTIPPLYKYNSLITAGNNPLDMYNTNNNYMGYTFSTIDVLMQKTYSLVYKPNLTINGNTYAPDFYYVNNYYVNPNSIIGSASISFTYSNTGTYSYGIDNLIYSTTASGRRYATIEWSYNGGIYSYFTTSVSNSPNYNIFNINTDGTIDYSPDFPPNTIGNTYSIRISTTSSIYTSSLFIPSVYTFSLVYGY